MVTTIQIEEGTKKKLDSLKIHHRETYNELITKMIEICSKIDKNDQYDKFLHEIQKKKMKEIWDNKYDESWEKL